MKKIILFLVIVWFGGCADSSNYGGGTPNPNVGAGGNNFDPTYHNGDPNSTFANSKCPASGKWGGVTCRGGSNRDESFLAFLSNGTNISSEKFIGDISCNPSNAGGILFRMKVTLNAPFDPTGQNNKDLTMQIGSSTLEIIIHDTLKNKYKPISAIFNGLSGEVNGNRATLTFDYPGKEIEIVTNKGRNTGKTFHSGRKQLKLEGTFNSEIFSGTIHFENEKYWDGRTPGARGTLGNFKIATCSVFTSN